MSRLPTPGADNGTWGNVLNDFLSQSHASDGTLKAGSVGASQVQDGALPKTKFDASTQASLGKADTAVQSVVGQTGTVTGAQIAADAALTGAFAPSSVSKRLASRISINTKLRGANIAPKPNGLNTTWAEWDWTNWIKPQIDRAVKLGCNAIRFIGSPEVVYVAPPSMSTITSTTYISRWVQLADYCTANNLYLYPSLVTKSDFVDSSLGFQDAGMTALVTSTAAALAPYSCIIGFDVFQEGAGVTALALADVLAMMAAIRSAAPGIPLTCSQPSSSWLNTTSIPYQALMAAGGSDFADYHVYEDGLVPTEADFVAAATNKPFIIGEYGASQSQSANAQTARFQAMAALHNRQGVLGSFFWALADQSANASNQWGVWDNTGFAQSFPFPSTAPLSTTSGQRTGLTAVLPQFNLASSVPDTVAPNLLSPTQSRPFITNTGWVVGGNTSISATPHGLALVSTTIGATSASTTPVSSVPVQPSRAYIACVTFLANSLSRAVSMQIDFYDSSQTIIAGSVSVAGLDSTSIPLTLYVETTSPANAAYAAVNVRITDTAQSAGETHWIRGAYLADVSTGAIPNAGPIAPIRRILSLSGAATLGIQPNTNYVYFLQTGAAPTLPSATSNINLYTLKNTTGSPITITGTVDGSANPSLAANASINIVSDGSAWHAV